MEACIARYKGSREAIDVKRARQRRSLAHAVEDSAADMSIDAGAGRERVSLELIRKAGKIAQEIRDGRGAWRKLQDGEPVNIHLDPDNPARGLVRIWLVS